MAMLEAWLPIVASAVSWAKDNWVSPNKQMKAHISDLEREVEILAGGNKMILENMESIIKAVISELKSDQYYVLADTAVFADGNSGTVSLPVTVVQDSNITVETVVQKQVGTQDLASFFVTDEELKMIKEQNPGKQR